MGLDITGAALHRPTVLLQTPYFLMFLPSSQGVHRVGGVPVEPGLGSGGYHTPAVGGVGFGEEVEEEDGSDHHKNNQAASLEVEARDPAPEVGGSEALLKGVHDGDEGGAGHLQGQEKR